MSVASIRALVKEKLESIDNVGKVQDYRRHHINWDKIIADVVEDGRVNACIIDWNSATGEKRASGSMLVQREHEFRVWFIYSLKDSIASAKTFDNIVEEIMNEFDQEQNLSSYVRWTVPAKLQSNQEAFYSDIFVHRAEIILTLEEAVAFNS